MLRRVIRIVAAVTAGVVTCLLVLFLFYLSPPLKDKLLSPSGKSECASIHPGMTKDEVLKQINRSIPPLLQDSSVPNLVRFERPFSHPPTACIVDFDPQTMKSTRSQVTVSVISLGEY